MINRGRGKTYFPAATRIIHHSIATSIIHLTIVTSILLKQRLFIWFLSPWLYIWILQHELPIIWYLLLKPLNTNCSWKSMSKYIFGYWMLDKSQKFSITEIERQNYSIWHTLCSISGYISHISSDKWNTILSLLLLSMNCQHLLKLQQNICLDCIFIPQDTRFGHKDSTQQTLSVEFSLRRPGTKIKIILSRFGFKGLKIYSQGVQTTIGSQEMQPAPTQTSKEQQIFLPFLSRRHVAFLYFGYKRSPLFFSSLQGSQ